MTAQPERHLSLVPALPGDDPGPAGQAGTEVITSGPLRPFAEVRAGTGFAWSCRQGQAENGELTEVHQITGGDRGEYERHMRAHGLKPPKSGYESWKPWKMPRPREYAPKPFDPGQHAEWDADGVTRTGVIWSRANAPNTWWAQPDDDPAHPVYLVRMRGSSDDRLYEIPQAAGEARANIIRGNIIRQRGIFPVLMDDSQGGPYVRWHSDPGCPRAAGKERYDRNRHGQISGSTCDGYRLWTALDIARELAASFRRQPPWLPMCPDCVTSLDISPATAPGHAEPEPAPAPGRASNPDDSANAPAGQAEPEPAAVPETAGSSPEPAASPAPAPASAPRGYRRPARFALRLEPPATDEEFLSSCAAIGTALTTLAGQLAAWADGLRALHFPGSVVGPLDLAADAISGAATGASRAAAAFEDEFRDARDIAARGMHITGQDTA